MSNMSSRALRPWQRLAAGLWLAGCALLAWGQEDPPGRVGRLNLTEGAVSFVPAEGGDWSAAELNRPLTTGDRLWTPRGARAELQFGASTARMDGETSLDFMQLDDQAAQLRLSQGGVQLRVRSLVDGERVELATPNLAFVAAEPGDYRVEVDPARGVTQVVVRRGSGTVYGERGEALRLAAGQQLATTGRNLAQVALPPSGGPDDFERWVAERDRAEEQSVAARYVSREVVGYQQLDAHGDWQTDPTYGAVWFPRLAVADWAPYRYGQWRWIAPWGWTWVDDAPWGFAPFHYGRWAQLGSRWCWVPGPRGPRPAYAPALVGFVGGTAGGVNWNIQISGGRPGVAWFPLAPGEAWRPGYRASAAYLDRVNRFGPGPRRDDPQHFRFQRHPHAVTAVEAADFERGRALRGRWHRVSDDDLARARPVAPPPQAGRGGPRGRDEDRAEDRRERQEDRAGERRDRNEDRVGDRRERGDDGRRQAGREQPAQDPRPGPYVQPRPPQAAGDGERGRPGDGPRWQAGPRPQAQPAREPGAPAVLPQVQAIPQPSLDRAQREQLQAQREQAQRERAERQQREAQQRAAGQDHQQRAQQEAEQRARVQQAQEQQGRMQRQQQDLAARARQQEQEQQQRVQRQQQEQVQRVQQQQQEQVERVQRQQQEHTQRMQRQQQDQAERAQRQQQEQQRAQRQQQDQAERAQRQQQEQMQRQQRGGGADQRRGGMQGRGDDEGPRRRDQRG